MTVTLQQLKDELSVASTMTKTKPQFLTEALTEVLNNEWKVNAIESNRSVYHQLEVEEGRKYLKVWERLCRDGVEDNTRAAGCSLIRIPANVTNLLVTKHLQKVFAI